VRKCDYWISICEKRIVTRRYSCLPKGWSIPNHVCASPRAAHRVRQKATQRAKPSSLAGGQPAPMNPCACARTHSSADHSIGHSQDPSDQSSSGSGKTRRWQGSAAHAPQPIGAVALHVVAMASLHGAETGAPGEGGGEGGGEAQPLLPTAWQAKSSCSAWLAAGTRCPTPATEAQSKFEPAGEHEHTPPARRPAK
jgi:hypothetical protein